jgi:hypothetical protein
METPTLIYCAGNNPTFAAIAITAGFRYGARLPATVYAPLYFADQEYKNPDRQAYMRALAEHKPKIASVLDWEQDEQLSEVLDWAEEASQFCNRVIIIPKVVSGIARLPKQVNGRDVILGYSVPTSYGGTCVPIWEFTGWPVHLLGGSPQRQMREWSQLSMIADVVSCDGNMSNQQAHRGRFWQSSKGYKGHWQQLSTTGDNERKDANARAFNLSCENIHKAWQEITRCSAPATGAGR